MEGIYKIQKMIQEHPADLEQQLRKMIVPRKKEIARLQKMIRKIRAGKSNHPNVNNGIVDPTSNHQVVPNVTINPPCGLLKNDSDFGGNSDSPAWGGFDLELELGFELELEDLGRSPLYGGNIAATLPPAPQDPDANLALPIGLAGGPLSTKGLGIMSPLVLVVIGKQSGADPCKLTFFVKFMPHSAMSSFTNCSNASFHNDVKVEFPSNKKWYVLLEASFKARICWYMCNLALGHGKCGHLTLEAKKALVTFVWPEKLFGDCDPTGGKILGLALLWAMFDAHAADLVPPDIRHQVTAKYIQLEAALADGVNPVKKVMGFASEHRGCVSLDEIEDNMDDLMTRSGQQQWRNSSIYAKLSSNQVELGELRNFVITTNMAQLNRQNKTIESILWHIAAAPVRQVGGVITLGGQPTWLGTLRAQPPALLGDCPRPLAVLWDEYVNGIGGRKPAREFSRHDLGVNRYKYTRRLVVWKVIQKLLDRGLNLATTISQIHSVYENVSMTLIINQLCKDEGRRGDNMLYG
eukprot:jgi/Psemu1/19281/gm1.19281_g